MKFPELDKAEKTAGMVEVVVEYTPELAEHILNNYNLANRKFKDSGISMFSRHLRAGTVVDDMDAIRFLPNLMTRNKQGFASKLPSDGPILADGQNRIEAIFQTGIPAKLRTRFNISEMEWKSVDSGNTRSESDRVAMHYSDKKVPHTNKVKAILCAYDNIISLSKKRPAVFADDIHQFYYDNQDILDLLNEVLNNQESKPCAAYGGALVMTRGLCRAPIKGCLFLTYQKYPTETKSFLKAFATADAGPQTGPALLRRRLREGRVSMQNARNEQDGGIVFQTLWCLKAWVESRETASIGKTEAKDKSQGLRRLIKFFNNDALYLVPGQQAPTDEEIAANEAALDESAA